MLPPGELALRRGAGALLQCVSNVWQGVVRRFFLLRNDRRGKPAVRWRQLRLVRLRRAVRDAFFTTTKLAYCKTLAIAAAQAALRQFTSQVCSLVPVGTASVASLQRSPATMARITALVAAATLCNAWTPARHIRPRSIQLRAADEDFDVDMMLLETEEKMQKSIAACVSNLGALRTGRASPDVLKRVVVDYYGADTPLNQLASISVASGTQLVVSPFDKSTLGDVEAALLDANLGMTPNNDGEIIRLNIPQLTEERRKDVAKEAKAVGEEAKVAVRSTRKKANDSVKKKGKDLSEDVAKDAQDQIQKLTDKLVKEIDQLVAKKEKEVMTV